MSFARSLRAVATTALDYLQPNFVSNIPGLRRLVFLTCLKAVSSRSYLALEALGRWGEPKPDLHPTPKQPTQHQKYFCCLS